MGHGSWYIDEEDPTLVRWHDGSGWTDYVLVRADWDGADGPPPPPDDPVWGSSPRGHVLRFAAGTAAAVLLVLVGALAVFGDGGSDDPSRGSTIGREAPDEDRSTADDFSSLGGVGVDADELGSDPSTDDEVDDVGGSDGGTTRTTRRSASGTTPTTRGSGVQRTEFRSETHTDGGSREVIGPRDDVQLGNSSATTIADRYNPPPPPPTTATTAAPATTATTAPPATTPTTSGTTGGATDG